MASVPKYSIGVFPGKWPCLCSLLDTPPTRRLRHLASHSIAPRLHQIGVVAIAAHRTYIICVGFVENSLAECETKKRVIKIFFTCSGFFQSNHPPAKKAHMEMPLYRLPQYTRHATTSSSHVALDNCFNMPPGSGGREAGRQTQIEQFDNKRRSERNKRGCLALERQIQRGYIVDD